MLFYYPSYLGGKETSSSYIEAADKLLLTPLLMPNNFLGNQISSFFPCILYFAISFLLVLFSQYRHILVLWQLNGSIRSCCT